MTVVIGSTRAAELAAADQTNNPVVLWDNIATVSNITSKFGDETGGPATNAVTGTTYDPAIPTVSGGIAALEVTGSSLVANSACIYAHNIADISASVRIQYSDDGGTSWTDAGAGTVTPSDNQAIIWRFDEQTHDDWRVQIFNASTNQPIIGGFCIGTEIVIEQRFYAGYAPPITPNRVDLIDNQSEGGHLLGTRFVQRGSAASVGIQHVSPATLRAATWKAFQNHFNQGGGFSFAWRPTKYGDGFWSWRGGDVIAPRNMGINELMEFTMDLRFYDDP